MARSMQARPIMFTVRMAVEEAALVVRRAALAIAADVGGPAANGDNPLSIPDCGVIDDRGFRVTPDWQGGPRGFKVTNAYAASDYFHAMHVECDLDELGRKSEDGQGIVVATIQANSEARAKHLLARALIRLGAIEGEPGDFTGQFGEGGGR